MTAKATKPEEEQKPAQPDLTEVLGSIVQQLDKLDSRMAKLEDGGKNEFKKHASAEDVAKATEGREAVDPRIVETVNSMLGEDFGIRIEPHKDGRLGYLFTLVVPPRLSDLPESDRPVKDPETGKYKVSPDGSTVMERYKPEDLRSKAISSTGNIDDIKQHCEKVRANIVAYYQKMQKPLPEFKIK